MTPIELSEAQIGALLDVFYTKVRADPELGPVFARAIADDEWPAHMAVIQDFWSAVMLKSGRYRGNPLQVHKEIEGSIKTKAHRIMADGDFVAVEARGDNLTKSGVPYCNTYCFVFRLEGGSLKEVTEYQDTELATRVLGDPGE